MARSKSCDARASRFRHATPEPSTSASKRPTTSLLMRRAVLRRDVLAKLHVGASRVMFESWRGLRVNSRALLIRTHSRARIANPGEDFYPGPVTRTLRGWGRAQPGNSKGSSAEANKPFKLNGSSN